MRGATSFSSDFRVPSSISIHAPHAGRDERIVRGIFILLYFNPRAPCGARPNTPPFYPDNGYFNPRAPCGARQLPLYRKIPTINFNPRAPCGARPIQGDDVRLGENFNPRAPCGARPGGFTMNIDSTIFQSTRPMRGATSHVQPPYR